VSFIPTRVNALSHHFGAAAIELAAAPTRLTASAPLARELLFRSIGLGEERIAINLNHPTGKVSLSVLLMTARVAPALAAGRANREDVIHGGEPSVRSIG
jgi:hypothetical protein